MEGQLESFDNSQVGNGAAHGIEIEQPYAIEATVEGVSALLFHKYDCDSVEQKAGAKKGSKAKKTDDVDSYVYRNEKKEICLPGEYIRQSIINAAKYIQDPRSPRKSGMDLFEAGIAVLDELCSLGSKDWEYLDKRPVVVNHARVPRLRPAFRPGWRARVTLQVLLPEYISPQLLNDRLQAAGKLIGVGDNRPTNGRFQVVRFDVLKD